MPSNPPPPKAAEKPNQLDHPVDATQRMIRDKAITAIHLRRVLRPKSGAGWGANRDDHPLFEKIANAWVNGNNDAYTDEELYTARDRVRKYERQLMASEYRTLILQQEVTRAEMTAVLKQAYAAKADHELQIALTGETYGQW